MNKKRLLYLLFFLCGMATSLLAIHCSSPRYWEIQRVSDVSEQLCAAEKTEQALDLLMYVGRRQSDIDKRDLLLLRACRIAQDSAALLETIDLCALSAEGPKRMAQAQSLMILAKAYRELGRIDNAIDVYQRVIDEYWDYRQSVAARRYLARLKLEAIFAGRPGIEMKDEIEKLVEEAGEPGADDVLIRSVALSSVIWHLDADRDPSTIIEKYLLKHNSKAGRTIFIDRLGAVIRTHASGKILRMALQKLGLPVRDSNGDLINFVAKEHEFPPSREECAEALKLAGNTNSLIAEFDRIGAPADGLRTQVAQLLRQAGREKEVIALLEGIIDRRDPDPHYAEANLAYARAMQTLWSEEEAAKRMEFIVDQWSQHGSVSMRAAVEGSGLFMQLGQKADAKRLLSKALAVATPDERPILESHAAGLGIEVRD